MENKNKTTKTTEKNCCDYCICPKCNNFQICECEFICHICDNEPTLSIEECWLNNGFNY